jgi:hypothetical protein
VCVCVCCGIFAQCKNCGVTTAAVTRQRPVKNNRGMAFSTQSMPMAAHATLDYVVPSLSNKFTATQELFPTRSVPRYYKQDELAVT